MARFESPIDAALERIESDAHHDDGFLGVANQFGNTAKSLAKGLLKLAASPLSAADVTREVIQGWQADAVKRTEENQIYLLDAVVDEVRSNSKDLSEHAEELERLSDIVDRTLAYVGPTTPRERLSRFAAIAVSGALVYTSDPPEQTDEFLRIADSLQETDVMVLREIGLIQLAQLDGFTSTDQILFQVQKSWVEILRRLGEIGIPKFSYRSAFVRLQSHGFLERTEPNMGTNQLGDTPYLLLELGIKFLEYLANHHIENGI